MFKAKTMNGEIVTPEDINYDYEAYKKYGLKCPECGDIVQLRNGDIRTPYFAHFKSVSNDLEDIGDVCRLRLTIISNSYSKLTQKGHNQRRKLFEEYFLQIIALTHIKFFEVIKQKTVDPNIKKLLLEICYKFRNSKAMITNLKFAKIPQKISQISIVEEVFDYLCVACNSYLLQKIIYLALLESKLDVKNLQEINLEEIIYVVFDLLIKVDWLSHFSKISDDLRQGKAFIMTIGNCEKYENTIKSNLEINYFNFQIIESCNSFKNLQDIITNPQGIVSFQYLKSNNKLSNYPCMEMELSENYQFTVKQNFKSFLGNQYSHFIEKDIITYCDLIMIYVDQCFEEKIFLNKDFAKICLSFDSHLNNEFLSLFTLFVKIFKYLQKNCKIVSEKIDGFIYSYTYSSLNEIDYNNIVIEWQQDYKKFLLRKSKRRSDESVRQNLVFYHPAMLSVPYYHFNDQKIIKHKKQCYVIKSKINIKESLFEVSFYTPEQADKIGSGKVAPYCLKVSLTFDFTLNIDIKEGQKIPKNSFLKIDGKDKIVESKGLLALYWLKSNHNKLDQFEENFSSNIVYEDGFKLLQWILLSYKSEIDNIDKSASYKLDKDIVMEAISKIDTTKVSTMLRLNVEAFTRLVKHWAF